jgi:hypothetical protein
MVIIIVDSLKALPDHTLRVVCIATMIETDMSATEIIEAAFEILGIYILDLNVSLIRIGIEMDHLRGIHINPFLDLGIHIVIHHRAIRPRRITQLTLPPLLHQLDLDMGIHPINQT